MAELMRKSLSKSSGKSGLFVQKRRFLRGCTQASVHFIVPSYAILAKKLAVLELLRFAPAH